jgi:hypothetical protein
MAKIAPVPAMKGQHDRSLLKRIGKSPLAPFGLRSQVRIPSVIAMFRTILTDTDLISTRKRHSVRLSNSEKLVVSLGTSRASQFQCRVAIWLCFRKDLTMKMPFALTAGLGVFAATAIA